MGRSVPLFFLLSGYSGVYAGEVINTLELHTKSDYEIISSMVIDGNSKQVFEILTDYEKLAKVSDIVLNSQKVTRQKDLNDGPIWGRINTRICILIFCFKAQIVEDIEIIEEHTIKAVMVPELSDFK
jgi:hypothetical protein